MIRKSLIRISNSDRDCLKRIRIEPSVLCGRLRGMRFFFQVVVAFAWFIMGGVASAEVTVLLTTFDTEDARFVELQTSLKETQPNVPVVVSVDRSLKFQKMLGYGGAMTDSSAYLLCKLKSLDQARYMETLTQLFCPEKGAGFSFLRLPMGASDYVATDRYYTYCDEPSDTLESFSIARDREFVIPVLRDVLEIQPHLRLIASPWSAPAWMKTNGKLIGVTTEEKAAGGTARLKEEYFDLYADYFVKFLTAYRAEGFEIHSVTLQNEPQNDLSDYPCMRMDTADQIRLVAALAPQIEEHGFMTEIYVHDHNWTLHPNDRQVHGGDQKAEPIDSVLAMFADPEVGPMIAGSAWHCYAGDARVMEKTYDLLAERFPGKSILTTEISAWGRNRGAWWGDVEWGMAHVWLRPQLHGSAAAIQWNIALDQEAGPTLRNDSEAIGLVTINSNNEYGVTFEREFYGMAHLSRAAPPGSVRIASFTGGPRSGGLDTIAFAMPDKKTSLVVFNRNGDSRKIRLSDRKGHLPYEIPGHSVLTLIW